MTSKLFKKVIYSGVQPSGSSGAHLGNYLGALRQWKVMQNQAAKDTTVLFALVDLHALSKLPQSCSRVTKAERQSSKAMLPSFVDNNRLMAATLLACDIDPQKSIIYRQSAVPQHTQLMWLLSCLTPISKLNRMTQYKDKAAEGDNLLSLLSYPVLMAADMLLFKATDVPVGDDQRQHLELTSDIVKAFNRFAKTQTFPIPKPIYGNDIANTRRIKNLSTPELKMSKSVGTEKSRICLSDTQDEIAKKISRAMTDSGNDVTYDPDNRPGIANLMDICAALLDKDAQQLLNEHQWQNASSLKQFTTDVLIEHVAPIGNRIRQYMKDPQELDSILKNGAERAETIANKNYKEIERVVGI